MSRVKVLPRSEDSRQRWSKDRLRAAHHACCFLLRWSEGEQVRNASYKVPLPPDLQVTLTEARDLLANELIPPGNKSLTLAPREVSALLTLLEEFPLSVTLTAVINKLRKLQ